MKRARLPLRPAHPERTCWGCDRYCPADDLACANGTTDLVELLLKAGADPNTALRGGETALMTAAHTGKAVETSAAVRISGSATFGSGTPGGGQWT